MYHMYRIDHMEDFIINEDFNRRFPQPTRVTPPFNWSKEEIEKIYDELSSIRPPNNSPIKIPLDNLLKSMSDIDKFMASHRDDYSTRNLANARESRVLQAIRALNVRRSNLLRTAESLLQGKRTKTRMNKYNTIMNEFKDLGQRKDRLNVLTAGTPIIITVTFDFEIVDNKGHSKTLHIRSSAAGKNNRADIERVVKSIKNTLLIKLLYYNLAVQKGGVYGTVHHILSGKKPGWRLVEHAGQLWKDFHVSTNELTLGGNLDMILNSDDAPHIEGLKSFTGEYGCVVETLSMITGKPRITIHDEFAEMNGLPKLMESISDDVCEVNEMIAVTGVKGFSTNQMIDYMNKYMKNYTWHIHSPLCESMHSSKTKTHNKLSVDFTILNNHLYVGKYLTTRISIKDMDYQCVDLGANWKDTVDELIASNERVVVYIGDHDLDEIAWWIKIKHNTLASVEPAEHGIEKLKIGNVVFAHGNEYVERKSFYEKLSLKYPMIADFKCDFADHQYTTMARAEFEHLYGELPRSFDSCRERELYRKYRTGPFIGHVAKQTLADEFIGHIDLDKCYAAVVLENVEAKIPVFRCNDYAVELIDERNRKYASEWIVNGELIGEVCIDEFKWNGFEVKKQWWPVQFAKDLLQYKAISFHHLCYIRQATQYHTLKEVANYTKHVLTQYPNESKNLYTRFYGMFGVNENKHYSGFLTTDCQYAVDGIAVGYKYHEVCTGIYMVYKKSSINILDNVNPVFRYIVCGSIMRMITIANRLKMIDRSMNILSARVDGIYYESKNISDWDVVNNIEDYIGTPWDIEHNGVKRTFRIAKWEDVKTRNLIKANPIGMDDESIYQHHDFSKNKCMFGPPGVGKSRTIAESSALFIGKTLGTCETNMIRGELKKVLSGVSNVTVRNFAELRVRWEKNKLKDVYDRIIIDEFSTMGDSEWAIINVLMNQSPKCELSIYGDPNQLKGVKRHRVCVKTSPMVRFLIPNDPIKMKYEFKEVSGYNTIGRMNRQLYYAVKEFFKSGKLPDVLLNRIVSEAPGIYSRNVAATNAMCRSIGAKLEAQGLKVEKQFICTRNDKFRRFNNGDEITMQQFIEWKLTNDDVIPSICCTAHKAQGKTFCHIECDQRVFEPGCIYEANLMTLEGLYVCMSRWGRVEDFWIIGDKDKLMNHVWVSEPDEPRRLVELQCNMASMFAIYLIKETERKHLYVGITECASGSDEDVLDAINGRLKEHINYHPDVIGPSSTTSEICRLRIIRNHQKLKDYETYWVNKYAEMTKAGMMYESWTSQNINLLDKVVKKKKQDKVLEEQLDIMYRQKQPVKIEKPTSVDKMNQGLDMLGLNHIKVLDDKIIWRQKLKECDSGVLSRKTTKKVAGVVVDCTFEALCGLWDSIIRWATTKGVSNTNIKAKLCECKII